MDRTELQKMGFATQSIHGGSSKNTFGALTAPDLSNINVYFRFGGTGRKEIRS